jgi:hypothetical protein
MLCKCNIWTLLTSTVEGQIYSCFKQDNAASAHMGNQSMATLEEVFGDKVISQWSQHFPDLNPCDFYLCSMLEDKVYINNAHMAAELENNICCVILNIYQELGVV